MKYFGERALQYDEPRSASVRSNETTEVLSLSKEVYEDIIKHYTADLINDV
jgi:CRP-like cAMP-binding protein